jgi:hypothetical protein
MIAMKVALSIAVLAFGGTALAARTGSLPAAVQERAHTIFSDVGVPAPEPDRSRQVTTDGVTGVPVPSRTPAPTRSATPQPSGTATLELCRTWDTARREPPGKAVPAEVRRALAAVAGGVPKIDEFCAGQLGKPSATAKSPGSGKSPSPAKTTTGPKATEPPAPEPSHPGKGKDNGKGNDKSRGPG